MHVRFDPADLVPIDEALVAELRTRLAAAGWSPDRDDAFAARMRAAVAGTARIGTERTPPAGWDEGWDATEVGFDAKIMFRPQFTTLREAPRVRIEGQAELEVRDYQAAWPLFARPEEVEYPHFDCVCPQWDNSARTGTRGVVLHNSTPDAYERWLGEVLNRARQRPEAERVVFVNAWNEWGEGCHLEPDTRSGHGYLEATRRALSAVPAGGSNRKQRRARTKIISTLSSKKP